MIFGIFEFPRDSEHEGFWQGRGAAGLSIVRRRNSSSGGVSGGISGGGGGAGAYEGKIYIPPW